MAFLSMFLGTIIVVAGCGEMEWNWDMQWWKSRQRVVRPVRQAQRESAPRELEPEEAAEENSISPTGPNTGSQHTTSEVVAKASTAQRTLYQLYLISGGESSATRRGEKQILLAKVKARTCAGVLEYLYVPLGRSGSEQECYLLYEDRLEFEAAAAIASSFDLAPIGDATESVGAPAAFTNGVQLLLGFIEQGAAIDPVKLKRCVSELARALQSSELPAEQRWMAGILAGRAEAEFRYNYSQAASYLQQADRLATDNSLEKLTARWWLADALARAGKFEQSDVLYESILSTWEESHPASHIVRRTKATLKQRKKK